MKAVEGGEGSLGGMLIGPLPSGTVSMSVMLPAVPEVGAAPADPSVAAAAISRHSFGAAIPKSASCRSKPNGHSAHSFGSSSARSTSVLYSVIGS